MTWQHQEPGHQQSWYWPSPPGIIQALSDNFSAQRINNADRPLMGFYHNGFIWRNIIWALSILREHIQRLRGTKWSYSVVPNLAGKPWCGVKPSEYSSVSHKVLICQILSPGLMPYNYHTVVFCEVTYTETHIISHNTAHTMHKQHTNNNTTTTPVCTYENILC